VTLSLAVSALYIRTNNDQQFPPSLLGIMAANLGATTTAGIDSGHKPTLASPAALTAILTDFTITLKS